MTYRDAGRLTGKKSCYELLICMYVGVSVCMSYAVNENCSKMYVDTAAEVWDNIFDWMFGVLVSAVQCSDYSIIVIVVEFI